ncbi:MAG: heat-inducible transcriptional repressor HrcA [Fimbriimonadaceae bacterium]|nr:heat-inducible transcriptional repressor HrcA [Fimbriimonadaceae bacterium]
MSDLDPRQQSILRAVIIEYVSAAEPVGSELIAQKYQLGVRSATVRNELAEMAERGFLEQPHTSAGRIPSDKGYRFYVDHLIVRQEPEAASKQKVREVTQDGEALRELLRETTRVLSRMTHLLSAATTVRDGNLVVRNVVISALGPERALLVVVLSNGHVENRMIECPAGLTLTELGQANEVLAQSAEGKTLRSLAKLKNPGSAANPHDKLLGTATSALKAMVKDLTRGSLITEGEEYIFGQPEIRRNEEYFRELVQSLENEETLLGALTVRSNEPQTVTIGKENREELLHPLTIVRQTFYVGEDEAGTLALIGPTRMNYDASIPLLNFTAHAISETLTKMLK